VKIQAPTQRRKREKGLGLDHKQHPTTHQVSNIGQSLIECHEEGSHNGKLSFHYASRAYGNTCIYKFGIGSCFHYATHDLELVSIVHALNMWRHYLMGKRFELRTNHTGLKYLFEQPTLNSRKKRWLKFLSECDFDIKHIKGKENNFFETLSRRVHLMHSTTFNMHQSYLKRRILDVFVIDQNYL
jgi:hypothetical protein